MLTKAIRYIILLSFVFLHECSPKYEVVEQLQPDLYHTIGKKDIILYKTDKKLKVGDYVRIPNKLKNDK